MLGIHLMRYFDYILLSVEFQNVYASYLRYILRQEVEKLHTLNGSIDMIEAAIYAEGDKLENIYESHTNVGWSQIK